MPLVPGAEPYHHEGGPVGALLIHGFTGSPMAMRAWGQRLAAEGLTVSVPRLPGHGTTWQEMNKTGWEDWYAEVQRAFDALRERCEQVFVMGLSMGGSLALRLAEDRGDQVAGLVLVNPAVHSERPDRHLLPFIYRFIPAFPGIKNDIAKPGQDEIGLRQDPAARRVLDGPRPVAGCPRRHRQGRPADAHAAERGRPRGREEQRRVDHGARVLGRRRGGHAARQLPRRHAGLRRAD